LKTKQGELASQPTHTTTSFEVVPLVATTIDPPTGQTSEAGPSSSTLVLAMETTTTTLEHTTSLSMQNMMKEIESLELQMVELKEAKEKLAKLEEKYDKSKQSVAEKTREVKDLEKKIRELERELTLDKNLAEVKKILWAKIGQSITDQCQSIETIHEQMDLINLAQFKNQKARVSLGNMPKLANRMIHILNTRIGGPSILQRKFTRIWYWKSTGTLRWLQFYSRGGVPFLTQSVNRLGQDPCGFDYQGYHCSTRVRMYS